MNIRALLHWKKVRIVRNAARKLPQFDIMWDVIAPRGANPHSSGWDYFLIRREWGFEVAQDYQEQLGGWILTL